MNQEEIKAAREALDDMDDYARMNTGVDAIGPRKVLEDFISTVEDELPAASDDARQRLSEALWSDLKTDKDRSDWLLVGRGYETGVVAKALQNDLAMAYHRLWLLQAGFVKDKP